MAIQAGAPGSNPAPWGLLGTIAWGAAGICVWFIVQFAVIVGFIAWRNTVDPGSADLGKMASDGFLLAFVTITAAPAWVGVSVFAAHLRKWSARDYLALVPPRRGEVVVGIVCLAALLIGFDVFTHLIGRDVVPSFMVEAYTSARSSGSLVLFFIAVVVVAPISEEVAFRGFLFRGLCASWLGVSGTLIATSAAWASMHVQYDAFTLAQIFLIGLLLGWIRWASGSTLLTIGLHVLANLTACIQAALKVEWMG
ncbi:MAG: CPBP family intramembrane glutamic endopeptidase [Alphaproteobacteria bacterium]